MTRNKAKGDFVVIQRFMWQGLKLSGVALLVYARIYGFSQDGSRDFYESKGNTAKYFGVSERMIFRTIKELTGRGLVHEVGTYKLGSGRETKIYRIDRAKAAEAMEASAACHDKSSDIKGIYPDESSYGGRSSPESVSEQIPSTPDESSETRMTGCHPIKKRDNKEFR